VRRRRSAGTSLDPNIRRKKRATCNSLRTKTTKVTSSECMTLESLCDHKTVRAVASGRGAEDPAAKGQPGQTCDVAGQLLEKGASLLLRSEDRTIGRQSPKERPYRLPNARQTRPIGGFARE